MHANAVSFAGYWRNSLADSNVGKGGLRTSDTKGFHKVSHQAVQRGVVPHDIVKACFDGERRDVAAVEVVFRPKVYLPRLEHLKRRESGLDCVTPIIATARLARDGRLYPIAAMVPRDILEPLVTGSFSIGSTKDQDSYLTRSPIDPIPFQEDGDPVDEAIFLEKWTKFLDDCDRLLKDLGRNGMDLDDEGGDFELGEYGFLLKKDSIFASKHILDLYDHIWQTDPNAPLFERFACVTPTDPEPCLNGFDAAFAAHLAHASDTYALAQAQRDALAHQIMAKSGEILAINGPPGTGKTTLLLSVVASLWAKAALDQDGPPVIVAASTNNQAVTNIIDAFGKDFATGTGPLAGRWLPGVKSFGAYFASSAKAAAAAEKYQTQSFFNEVESADYVESAQLVFLEAAVRAFPEQLSDRSSLSDVVNVLHAALRNEVEKLQSIKAGWNDWLNASTPQWVVRKEGNASDIACVYEHMEMEENRLQRLKVEKERIEELTRTWEAHMAAEPLFQVLFSWLPAMSQKRHRFARLGLQSAPDIWEAAQSKTLSEIEQYLKAQKSRAVTAYATQEAVLNEGRRLRERADAAYASLRQLLLPLGLDTQWDGRITQRAMEEMADTQIRFKIFLLTTHYWEARWLVEMQSLAPDFQKERNKTGRVAVEKRWRRRMMLTPCVVSTFYMLPKEMQVKRHDGSGFVSDYLYDFADLLIVDEAGQVLPEVAGASFALARQAMVIGDTLQIEPIWSIPASVDIGNLMTAGLLPRGDHEQAYEMLGDLGKTAASGSVMRIAQTMTRYHYDQDLARGMFLYEHRRCYDEIIRYCNDLCYKGKLIPKRGAKPVVDAQSHSPLSLPAMGYLHVDGICVQHGASRRNTHEAKTIAAWLREHGDALKKQYDKPLHEVVAVVTPFGQQVQAISAACREAGIDVHAGPGGMTVGTVHALQGAERPIVIFSPVYSKHADGGFIDQRDSMLNVGVSRAKDCFLVFGDMDVLSSAPSGTPRGLLAKHLLASKENALVFETQVRNDLSRRREVLTLRDAGEHDQFLLESINASSGTLQIVSPWIVLSRVHEIGAFEALRLASSRGVNITIYADTELNESETLAQAGAALQSIGVTLRGVHRVHSKVLIGDDALYCVGSFNWLSARRDKPYARHETSVVYRGQGLADEIKAMRSSLEARVVVPRLQRPGVTVG